jgi:2-polyprenyl-3-methyl-5-hydroxy-6-metoxy-1,4-benzoquinol methylase
VITAAMMGDQLRCPHHAMPLSSAGDARDANALVCASSCRFDIVRGIPRFVPRDQYAASFGTQWLTYPRTQLDSYTGYPYSRQRLEGCLGGSLDSLKDKSVLEVGCGAGRFTELLLDYADSVTAIDLSEAVEANLANCRAKGPYLLCQADINASPLPRGAFDVVLCIGAIQHTPSPETTIISLAAHVKPGGWLVIDHYTWKSLSSLTLAYPLRAVLRWVARTHPSWALRVTKRITAICDPIRRRTVHRPWLDRIASRLFPSICHYRSYPALSPTIVYEWNELDTHAILTDWYRWFRSPTQIRHTLAALGFENITCGYGGNGVEARARRPATVLAAAPASR